MLSFVYLDQTNYEANNQFPIRTIKNFKSKELSPCVWYYGLSRHMVKSLILRPMPDSWWPSSLLSFFPPTPPFTWLLSWACIIIIAVKWMNPYPCPDVPSKLSTRTGTTVHFHLLFLPSPPPQRLHYFYGQADWQPGRQASSLQSFSVDGDGGTGGLNSIAR